MTFGSQCSFKLCRGTLIVSSETFQVAMHKVDDLLIASGRSRESRVIFDLVFSKLSEHGVAKILATLNFTIVFKDAAKEQACLHGLVAHVKKDNTPIAWTEDTRSAFESCKRLTLMRQHYLSCCRRSRSSPPVPARQHRESLKSSPQWKTFPAELVCIQALHRFRD
ncbi:hypothetical protein AVEN_78107-1 [Araneus ventricosus]|uniref:Reverse transcriptase/retrotransposon-derived protein RNase H-like domain-containing protein n=1 Tax=Araneus ventricosus TaxID=182803 RepID=A0A4Y2F3N4_ARAVE|nr:hypothetical protein AVEN_78107-1 [Araneus ventricosus]